jgi:hypothetical protein
MRIIKQGRRRVSSVAVNNGAGAGHEQERVAPIGLRAHYN